MEVGGMAWALGKAIEETDRSGTKARVRVTAVIGFRRGSNENALCIVFSEFYQQTMW